MNGELRIPATFIRYASDILGDTSGGLSGTTIIGELGAYAVEYNVDVPHQTCPFEAPNKRTALYENLMVFSSPQQYRIIKDLCNHRSLDERPSAARSELKIRLVTRYSALSESDELSKINETLIEETRHWLAEHPEVLSLYNAALEKYESGVYLRNLLDDLRLSLEKLLQDVLSNGRSLENQIREVGAYLKSKGASKEFSNMFVALVDYFSKYQNSYVKHDDAVIEEEIEFLFEITSSFMKHVTRLSGLG